MAQTRKEYWSEVRSVYKDPKDYVLAGRGNAYVRIDAEAKVTGTAELTFDTKCDRCLTEVPTAMKLKFDRIVYSPEAEVSEEEDTEQSFMDGWQLDVEAFVYDEILVNWPAKILCKEDCKGICPVCGQNRNLKECGCDTFVPDPRMAAIQDIFNANKEV